MDNAYDAPEIRAARRALGHVPIINAPWYYIPLAAASGFDVHTIL